MMDPGYRRLALEVIKAAVEDYQVDAPAGTRRGNNARSARRFLNPAYPLFRHWCQVAGLHPRRVWLAAQTRVNSVDS